MSTFQGSDDEIGRLYPTPSDEGAETWRQFAAAHGVSITGIVEALATELRRLETLDDLPAFWRAVIDEARAHDAEGRSRETPT